ncbi:MAG: hypothetical protein BJ554DRAFT_7818 [Olpidium bornovanus]|uniref:Uncharacterized protein n=1 Tax=Olpidium bornovanus TaxID=278681 RepID=A0A8H7ZV15_9FUNG|nr:MAG: hypothetical protein BJ554DRAFT_7818 [Olpidium bornovanus]
MAADRGHRQNETEERRAAAEHEKQQPPPPPYHQLQEGNCGAGGRQAHALGDVLRRYVPGACFPNAGSALAALEEIPTRFRLPPSFAGRSEALREFRKKARAAGGSERMGEAHASELADFCNQALSLLADALAIACFAREVREGPRVFAALLRESPRLLTRKSPTRGTAQLDVSG